MSGTPTGTPSSPDDLTVVHDGWGRDATFDLDGDHELPADHIAAMARELAAGAGLLHGRPPGSTGDEMERLLAAHDRLAAALDRHQAALDRYRAAQLLQRSYIDSLTGCLQRDAGRDHMLRAVERCRRTHEALTCAFLDVDHLKDVNDRGGHADGDALLRALGRALRSSLRTTDVVVRYGGDEFVCALPGATPEEALLRFADARTMFTQSRPNDTISIGLAQLRADESLDHMLNRADAALYAARKKARSGGG